MDERNADTFDLTEADRAKVCALAELLVQLVEDACPELVVQTVDLELRPAHHARPTLSAA